MRYRAKLVLAVGVLIAGVADAKAALQSFNSLGRLAAAAGTPLNHVDFASVSLPPVQQFEQIFPPAGITRFPAGNLGNGVNFSLDQTHDDGDLFVVAPNYFYPSSNPAPAISSEQSTLSNNNLVITLSAPAHAVGMTLGSLYTSDFQITLSNGATLSTATQNQGLGFVGLVSQAPFSSLRIDITSGQFADADVINLSDLYFSNSLRPTPLPGTLAIFAGGSLAVGTFGWVSRRIKTR